MTNAAVVDAQPMPAPWSVGGRRRSVRLDPRRGAEPMPAVEPGADADDISLLGSDADDIFRGHARVVVTQAEKAKGSEVDAFYVAPEAAPHEPFLFLRETSEENWRLCCTPCHAYELRARGDAAGPVLLEMSKPWHWCGSPLHGRRLRGSRCARARRSRPRASRSPRSPRSPTATARWASCATTRAWGKCPWRPVRSSSSGTFGIDNETSLEPSGKYSDFQ